MKKILREKNVKFLFICFLFLSLSILSENSFYLNFNNVDIRTFIKFISEITKENYVIDQNVRGTITIYSTTPIPVEQIERVFKSVLNFYGFTAIKKDNLSLIVPVVDGRTKTKYINIS
ncbi:MAG: hypothetical protein ACPLZ9_06810, partial [Candidatus Ratteibacteria bacterium]